MSHPTIRAIRKVMRNHLKRAIEESGKVVMSANGKMIGQAPAATDLAEMKEDFIRLIREATVALGMATILHAINTGEKEIGGVQLSELDQATICQYCGGVLEKEVQDEG